MKREGRGMAVSYIQQYSDMVHRHAVLRHGACMKALTKLPCTVSAGYSWWPGGCLQSSCEPGTRDSWMGGGS